MYVSVDELKKDALKYILLVNTENIIITHKGEKVARFECLPKSIPKIHSMSKEERMKIFKSLVGME